MKKQNLLLIIVLIGAVFIFGVTKLKKKEVITVDFAKVEYKIIESKISTDGIINIKNRKKIYAEFPQKVQDVKIKKGNLVEKGETIFNYSGEYIDDLNRAILRKKIDLKILNNGLKELELSMSEEEVRSKKFILTTYKKDIKTIEIEIVKLKKEKSNFAKQLLIKEERYENKKKLYSLGALSKAELDDIKVEIDEGTKRADLIDLDIEKTEIEKNRILQKIEFEKKELKEMENQIKKRKIRRELSIKNQSSEIEKLKLEITNDEKRAKRIKKEIKSSIDGMVYELNAEEGLKVEEGIKLVEIIDLENLIIKANISEYDIKNIYIDQIVRISSEIIGKDIIVIGKVKKIANIAKKIENGNTVEKIIEVEIEFNNSKDYVLKPGYSVKLNFEKEKRENALVIPRLSIIRDDENSDYVYVINGENAVVKKEIKIGMVSLKYAEVLDGLAEGENIIVSPGEKIKSGIVVTKNGDENNDKN